MKVWITNGWERKRQWRSVTPRRGAVAQLTVSARPAIMNWEGEKSLEIKRWGGGGGNQAIKRRRMTKRANPSGSSRSAQHPPPLPTAPERVFFFPQRELQSAGAKSDSCWAPKLFGVLWPISNFRKDSKSWNRKLAPGGDPFTRPLYRLCGVSRLSSRDAWDKM